MHEGSFDLTITSRLTTRSMENVSVELYLGEGASGASCTASHNSSWTFNPKNLVHLSIRLSLACYSRHCTDTTMGDEEPSSIFQLYATRDVHIDVNVFPSFLESLTFGYILCLVRNIHGRRVRSTYASIFCSIRSPHSR